MVFSRLAAFDENDLADVSAASDKSVLSDAEKVFIEKLQAGDAAALDQMVEKYSTDVFAVLFRLTGDREESLDLMQETFLSAMRSVGTFRGESGLRTWLVRIAINHSRNRFRWWKRRRRDATASLDAPAAEDSTESIASRIADNSEDPESAVLRRERQAAIMNAILSLNEAYREAVILCDIEGWSYDEIAGALDVNIGTVKSRIARGREELRRRLNGI